MMTRIRARDLLRAESSSAKITAPWTAKRETLHLRDGSTETGVKTVTSPPTVIAFVADVLVLGVEHGLLQHAEDDDSADPELDSKQIPPIAGAPEEPQSPEQHIHDAHDHEELMGRGERQVIGFVSPLQRGPRPNFRLTYHHQGPVSWGGVVVWTLHFHFH